MIKKYNGTDKKRVEMDYGKKHNDRVTTSKKRRVIERLLDVSEILCHPRHLTMFIMTSRHGNNTIRWIDSVRD